MTSTTARAPNGSTKIEMSEASIKWDQAEKGFLSEAERIAKNMDVDGKGHLSRSESVRLGSQFQSLKEDNQSIKKQLCGLAALCVLLFIGTVVGTVIAIKNSKDTVVDTQTGLMKVKDGNDGVDVVTVKAQGMTFQTTGGSVVMNEGTTTNLVVAHCVSAEDVASMWLANEQGTDARLLILEDGQNGDDQDTEMSSIEPVTTGRATWNEDHVVMGGMIFIPNEECTNDDNRRKLLEGNGIDSNDTPSFDSTSIHRELKHRVNFLSGRSLQKISTGTGVYSTYITVNGPANAIPTPIDLGNAEKFVILSQTGISNVPSSSITGDIAVSPIAAAAITGFVLAKDTDQQFSTDIQITGKVYASDYLSPTPSVLGTAILDMQAAYTAAAGRLTTSAAYLNLYGGKIGGKVLGPGVYTFDRDVIISAGTKVIFQATNPDTDVFIIQTTGSLLQASATQVILEGNAKPENIFWQVAGVVTIGAGAHLEGIVLAKTGVTFITGSSLNGRVLAQTAVALQMATIVDPLK
jgi:hypothetical protein